MASGNDQPAQKVAEQAHFVGPEAVAGEPSPVGRPPTLDQDGGGMSRRKRSFPSRSCEDRPSPAPRGPATR